MEGDYPFRTGRGSTGNLESYGDPFDPANPNYGKDVFATSSMIDGGMPIENGWMYRGTDMPSVPEGQKGYFTMVNTGPGLRTMNDGILDEGAQDTTWRFVAEDEKAPEAAPRQQMADDPAPQGPTIYDSTEDWIRIARAEDQGRNRMPFVGPNWSDGNKTYGDIPYDPLLSLEMFYPTAQNQFQQNNKSPYDGGLLSASLAGMGGGGSLDTSMIRNSAGGYGGSSATKSPGTSYDLRANLR